MLKIENVDKYVPTKLSTYLQANAAITSESRIYMYQCLQKLTADQDCKIFSFDCDSIIFRWKKNKVIPLSLHCHILGSFKNEV